MDPYGHIYMDEDPSKIPAEDKARLDGYLRGRAEAELLKLTDERKAEIEAKVRELEEAQKRVQGDG